MEKDFPMPPNKSSLIVYFVMAGVICYIVSLGIINTHHLSNYFSRYIRVRKSEEENLPFESIVGDLDIDHLPMIPNAETFPLWKPDGEFSFLHESAVVAFHGIIFCSWYNCRVNELHDFTPIRGCFSKDGGKSWSAVETLGADPSGKFLYCPPVYAIANDMLYLLMNTMVSADHIHSLETYRYDEAAGKFVFVRSDRVVLQRIKLADFQQRMAPAGRIRRQTGSPSAMELSMRLRMEPPPVHYLHHGDRSESTPKSGAMMSIVLL